MERKYELTDNTIVVDGHVLHAIRALKDFGNVCKGQIGGYIESEDNLSQEGDCWVYHCAKVYQHARILDHATVDEFAYVHGNARVHGRVRISGEAVVSGYTLLSGRAFISGHAMIYDHATVHERAYVSGNAHIYEDADVCGDAGIAGDAQVFGHASIRSSARIGGDSMIHNTKDVIVVGPIGSRNDYTTFSRTKNGIHAVCGCFSGTLKNFEKEVGRVHVGTEYENEYLDAIEFAKKRLLKNGETWRDVKERNTK